MSTLTKEWLLKTIAELEEERDAVPGAVNEDAVMALAEMKLALASLEAEHAGFIVKHKITGKFGSWLHSKADWFRSDEYEVLSAYTAPPATVSMKDHQIRELVNELRDISVEYHGTQQLRERIARTIRAAMLQGADGNSPVIPDGWVACSERMPEVGVKVLCFPINDEPIHATYNGQVWLQDISWSTSDEPIDNVISCNVFHWMPLPAAPQQEVK
ncbi:DUF551 domain-containing protein [Escherichia coli]|nr:DUF551 domain-containing protein [Escherichia coli]